MPNFIKNLGLDFLWEDDDVMMNFMGYLTENGKAISGYYGCPNFFNPMGDIDFFVRTKKGENGQLAVVGLDTHCCGRNIWEMRNSGIDITPKDSLQTDRVFLFNSIEDGSGLIPIHLINADVLPSFLEGDVVNMQMCAFPLDINYYADEEDYSEHQPVSDNGEHWLIADGSLMGLNFLINHSINNDDKEKDYSTDDYVSFRGTVKRLQHGVFKMGENKENTYIRCVIDTHYGELQFAHTIDQVDPEQIDNLKVGAVVSGVCIISGDVAINEYTDGIVKDFDNNFRLMRQVITNGEAERMHPVLSEDAVYISDSSKKTYTGAEEIIERFNYVHGANDKCLATPATIISLDSDELKYPVGTRCLLISYNDNAEYKAIVFIDLDENGDIKRIYVTTDSRYHFKADEKIEDDLPFED